MSGSSRGRRLDWGASRAVLFTALVSFLLTLGRADDRWDRAKAERQLELARAARAAAESAEEPSRDLYLKAIGLYRQVYRSDPHFGGADDAIFEAGVVAQSAGERFGNPDDYKRAAQQFEYLVRDYATSPFCPEAWLRLGDLKAGPLQDENGALAAYDALKKRYPRSKAAREFLTRTADRASERAADSKPAPIPSEKTTPEATTPNPAAQPAPSTLSPNGSRTTISSIRHWSTDDYTRVVIDMDHETGWRKTLLSTPDRLFFDIANAKASRELLNRVFPVGDEFLRQVRVGQNRLDVVRVVLDFEHIAEHTVLELHDPYRLVIDIHGTRRTGSQRAATGSQSTPRPDELGSSGSKSLQPMVTAGKPEPSLPRASVPASPPAAKSSPTSDKGSSAAVPGTPRAVDTPAPERRAGVPKADRVRTEGEIAFRADTETRLPLPPPATKPMPAVDAAAPAVAKAAPSAVSLPPPKVAAPTSTGSRTLTRMLGLKIGRIVIDPGHGGHDTGTAGRNGLLEKDLVLGIAHELRRMLEEHLGAEVVMTREDDRFVPLEERTAIANQKRADLFVSIHANSSSSRATSGVETYYLDFARTAAARDVAARENATSIRNISELENLIKQIVQADKSTESREFAAKVQRKLFTGARPLFPAARNRGVRSAPFVVLIGANMPSILAEVAFISNPRDEKTLKDDSNRGRLAHALFSGIQDYMKSLGAEVAQNRGQ